MIKDASCYYYNIYVRHVNSCPHGKKQRASGVNLTPPPTSPLEPAGTGTSLHAARHHKLFYCHDYYCCYDLLSSMETTLISLAKKKKTSNMNSVPGLEGKEGQNSMIHMTVSPPTNRRLPTVTDSLSHQSPSLPPPPPPPRPPPPPPPPYPPPPPP